jgi:hypothetical protein
MKKALLLFAGLLAMSMSASAWELIDEKTPPPSWKADNAAYVQYESDAKAKRYAEVKPDTICTTQDPIVRPSATFKTKNEGLYKLFKSETSSGQGYYKVSYAAECGQTPPPDPTPPVEPPKDCPKVESLIGKHRIYINPTTISPNKCTVLEFEVIDLMGDGKRKIVNYKTYDATEVINGVEVCREL